MCGVQWSIQEPDGIATAARTVRTISERIRNEHETKTSWFVLWIPENKETLEKDEFFEWERCTLLLIAASCAEKS